MCVSSLDYSYSQVATPVLCIVRFINKNSSQSVSLFFQRWQRKVQEPRVNLNRVGFWIFVVFFRVRVYPSQKK